MKPSTYQILTSSSKKMLLILRVLFVFLIVTAILPWMVPKSGLGAFLLSTLSIIKLFHGPQTFDYFLNNLSAISKVLGFLGTMVNLLPLFIGIFIMMQLSKRYITRQVFSIANAKSYRNLGIIYLLSAILLQPIAQVLFSLSISFIHHHVGQRSIALNIDINTITEIFFAIVLMVIGHVMQLGQKMKEEQELIV